MMNDQRFYWDEKTVMLYLEEAASIHRRLPEVSVPGYRTLWPDTLQENWQQLYDVMNGKGRLGSPMPAEVTFHDEVSEWLRYLDRGRQQVVWMRANRIPWKILVDELGRSKQTLWRELRASLCEIATRLNVTDSDGEEHTRLRLRANGAYQHDGTLPLLQSVLF